MMPLPIYFKQVNSLSRFLLPLLLTVAILVNFGCAAMLEGSRQTIKIHCEPGYGIAAIVNGEEIQFKNGVIILDKKRETHFVTLKKMVIIHPHWLLTEK